MEHPSMTTAPPPQIMAFERIVKYEKKPGKKLKKTIDITSKLKNGKLKRSDAGVSRTHSRKEQSPLLFKIKGIINGKKITKKVRFQPGIISPKITAKTSKKNTFRPQFRPPGILRMLRNTVKTRQ